MAKSPHIAQGVILKNYLHKFYVSACIALASYCAVGYVNAQSVKRAPAPAPAPAPAAEAPAPAAEVPEAPAPPLPAPMAVTPNQGFQGQLPANGVYQSSCRNSQVPGTSQTISLRNVLFVADGFGRMQRAVNFFLSPDCSGSVYAAFNFPTHTGKSLGQRATVLPDNGQTVMGTVHITQPTAGKLEIFGAVMQLPNDAATVAVVVNGVQAFTAPVNQRVDEQRILLYPTRGGLYMTNNREAGAVLDSQGFPTTFLRGMEMTRIQ